MKKKLLLLALVGLMLTGCGSESVEDVANGVGVESTDAEVAESSSNVTELVELKIIPESTAVTEEVKEDPKISFTEEYKEKFSERIEEITGTTAQCLGIELDYRRAYIEHMLLSNNPVVQYKYAYFLVDDTKIVKVHVAGFLRGSMSAIELNETEQNFLAKRGYLQITDFQSVDEFMEVALAEPLIVALDKNSSPLFVDMDEITAYIEIMEPVLMEYLNNEDIIGGTPREELAVEMDEVMAEEIVKQTVSYVSCYLKTVCGEDYHLLGYENKFYVGENNAIINSFVVEDIEGKIYMCKAGEDNGNYQPTVFYDSLYNPVEDREGFVEYVKNNSNWVLWEDTK